MNKLFIATVLCICCLVSRAQQQRLDILIKNITVITLGQGRVLKNATVGIVKDRIVFIGKPTKQTANRVIDGKGKFLMPGLYDMHVHWPATKPDRFFQLLTMAGITTIRMMNSDPAAIAFRDKAIAEKLPMPSQYIGFPVTARDASIHYKNLLPFIDSIRVAGYDFIKIFSIPSPEDFDSLVNAAAIKHMMICGHPLQNIPPEKLIRSGYRSIEHVGYFDKIKTAARFDSLATLALQYNTFICPTLDWNNMVFHSYPKALLQDRQGYAIGKKLYNPGWDSVYARFERKYTADELKKNADNMRNTVNAKIAALNKLYNKGLVIIAGADAEEPYQTPGYSLIEELLLMQQAGLTNEALLKTATINAAAFFGEEKLKGTVEKDKIADLIILSKDPLADIRNLSTVELVIHANSVTKTEELAKRIK